MRRTKRAWPVGLVLAALGVAIWLPAPSEAAPDYNSMMQAMGYNQLGLLEFCNARGFAPQEAIAAMRAQLDGRGQPAVGQAALQALAHGQAGRMSIANPADGSVQVVDFVQAEAAMPGMLAQTCRSLARAMPGVTGGL